VSNSPSGAAQETVAQPKLYDCRDAYSQTLGDMAGAATRGVRGHYDSLSSAS